MILPSKENAITYRCPRCGGHVLSMMGVFRLSGDMIKLKCQCGSSRLVITRQPGDKLSLEVPCIFCEESHRYVIDRKQFFSRKAFSLTCRVTGLDVCCIGGEEAVKQYAEESDVKLDGILKDCGFASLEDYLGRVAMSRGDDGEADEGSEEEEILVDEGDVIAAADFILSELQEEQAIHCGCAHSSGDYAYRYQGGILQCFCRTCGSEVEMPLRTNAELRAFLDLDELELEKIAVIDFDSIPFAPDDEDE